MRTRGGETGPGPSYLWLIAGDGAEPGVKSRLWSAVHATACSMSDRYRCCRLLCMLTTLPTGTQQPATREFAPARQSAPDPARPLADALTGVRCPARAPNNGGRTAASWGHSQPAPLASSSYRGRPDSSNSVGFSGSSSTAAPGDPARLTAASAAAYRQLQTLRQLGSTRRRRSSHYGSSGSSTVAPGGDSARLTAAAARRHRATTRLALKEHSSSVVRDGDTARRRQRQPGSTRRRRRSLTARQLGSYRRRRSSHDSSSSSVAPGGARPTAAATRPRQAETRRTAAAAGRHRTASQLAGRRSRSSSGISSCSRSGSTSSSYSSSSSSSSSSAVVPDSDAAPRQ